MANGRRPRSLFAVPPIETPAPRRRLDLFASVPAPRPPAPAGPSIVDQLRALGIAPPHAEIREARAPRRPAYRRPAVAGQLPAEGVFALPSTVPYLPSPDLQARIEALREGERVAATQSLTGRLKTAGMLALNIPIPEAAGALRAAAGARVIAQARRAARIARAAGEALAAGEGGFTLAQSGRRFAGTGYLVADPAVTRLVDEINPQAIETFLADPDVARALRRPRSYVGGYRNPVTGQWELNVTDAVSDRARAVQLGRDRGQLTVGLAREGRYVSDVPAGNAEIAQLAEQYRAGTGVAGSRLPEVGEVDREAGRRMAETYERIASAPDDPEVRAAYDQMSREVDAQFQSIENAGYEIAFVDRDPYKNSTEMMNDVLQNRRLRVLRTSEESAHPLLTREQNDRFRAVHDFFGHAQFGHQFGPRGEENAFRSHSAMFSPQARRAMATETRGQNSWVNFGPGADRPPAERPFAQQKAALWPEEMTGEYEAVRAAPVPTPASQTVPPAESIRSAVVRVKGRDFRGSTHGEAMLAAEDVLGPTAINEPVEELFETSSGKIVSRQEATDLVNLPRWPAEEGRMLAAEDLPLSVQRGGIVGTPAQVPTVITSPARQRIQDSLLAEEAALLTRRGGEQIEQIARTLPGAETMAAGAVAGRAKRGWYQNSAAAIVDAFGPEAPRFAGLLAALSPQQGVSRNLGGALDAWEVWNAAGRPTDERSIARLLNDVARRTPEGRELGSRIPNAVAVLRSEDPARYVLSGPKVSSFHRNLMGDTQRITNDTWMAQLANVDPASLSASRAIGGREMRVASPTYLALSGRVRETADYLSRATGRAWTPAEVQETLWSWGKALSESAAPGTAEMSAGQLSLLGSTGLRTAIPSLTEEAIRGVPDFATLLGREPYAGSLERTGLPIPSPRPPVPTELGAYRPPPTELERLAENIERSRQGLFGLAGGEAGAVGGPGFVYRVEQPPIFRGRIGVGPYNRFRSPTGGLPEVVESNPEAARAIEGLRHPAPYEDVELLRGAPEGEELGVSYDPAFGFAHPEHVTNWFPEPALRGLGERGYGVSIYRSPEFQYSGYQAMFDPMAAERAAHYPIEEWLRLRAAGLRPWEAAAGPSTVLPTLGLTAGLSGGALAGYGLFERARRQRAQPPLRPFERQPIR